MNEAPRYVLRLFVAGDGPRSRAAQENLHEICERHLAGRYEIELVDILADPERAERERVLATPTLLVVSPHAGRRIVGDLSVTERVLVGMGLRPNVWTWRRGH